MSEFYYAKHEDDELWRDDNARDVIDSILGDLSQTEWDRLPEKHTIKIFKGSVKTEKASRFIYDVLDYMAERALDEHDETAEGWPDLSGEQEKELQKGVEKYIDDFFDKVKQQPTFGIITDIKPVTVEITKKPDNHFDCVELD